MGKKKQKLVRHTAEQLADTPSANIHTASMYTFQSGKPLVRTESLVGAHVAPTTVPPTTLLHNEDSPPASNQWQIYQAGSFLDYMPIPDEFRVETETSKRKRTAGDHPLAAWQPECPTFLDEMIRLEGRGDYAEDSELYCPSCTVERHRCLPLHRLQRWNGNYFERITLKSLGYAFSWGTVSETRAATLTMRSMTTS
ncbi:uncharacterized protein F5147DRAFT_781572 [Suillus discolor]|uniref:Uncharacterized protein n=1 Tax=Suillus discolor TaxID=1912936 RepID=A0A9P7ESY0_9AGAM|nr:uncharacterized protein F5147DRAFT_781572 [Suillus discolor]KAG2086585.1 hypothetical protein F5147DRAFT_781572 [Suillus discolor]